MKEAQGNVYEGTECRIAWSLKDVWAEAIKGPCGTHEQINSASKDKGKTN